MSIPSPYNFQFNHSYFKFRIKIHNSGVDPIEDFKLLFKFDGDFQDLYTGSKGGNSLLGINVPYTPNTYFNKNDKTGKFAPLRKILVGDDSIISDIIRIKPLHQETVIIISWKLISKDFKDEGQLKLILIPKILKDYKTVLVQDQLEVRIEKGEIEDHITKDKEIEVDEE
jgi:hypothetical protein